MRCFSRAGACSVEIGDGLVRSPWTLIVFLEPGGDAWLGVGALLSGWMSWNLWPHWSTTISWKRASCLFSCKAETQFLAEAVWAKRGTIARLGLPTARSAGMKYISLFFFGLP